MSRRRLRVRSYHVRLVVRAGVLVAVKLPPSTIKALLRVVGDGHLKIGGNETHVGEAGQWLGARVYLDVRGAMREIAEMASKTATNGTGVHDDD